MVLSGGVPTRHTEAVNGRWTTDHAAIADPTATAATSADGKCASYREQLMAIHTCQEMCKGLGDFSSAGMTQCVSTECAGDIGGMIGHMRECPVRYKQCS